MCVCSRAGDATLSRCVAGGMTPRRLAIASNEAEVGCAFRTLVEELVSSAVIAATGSIDAAWCSACLCLPFSIRIDGRVFSNAVGRAAIALRKHTPTMHKTNTLVELDKGRNESTTHGAPARRPVFICVYLAESAKMRRTCLLTNHQHASAMNTFAQLA